MLGRLFKHEKHIRMVADVYQNGGGSEERLSKLITYLKSKTSSIPCVLDYLKTRAREEVSASGQLRTGSRILRMIVDQLRGVSICYESRMIRIFVGVVKEILRLKRAGRFEYSDHQEFLDLFVYFFETVPIRTHKSEKYIRKILLAATGVTGTGLGGGCRPDLLSDDGEWKRLPGEAVGSEDESSSTVDVAGCDGDGEMADAWFDYLFLEMIHTLMGVENILQTDYDEKYGWLVNSLIRPGEMNSLKRREVFRLVAQKANAINVHSLVYYVLRYSSDMGRASGEVLLELLQCNFYTHIVLQTNINILEKGEVGRVGECRILVQDALGVLQSHEISHLNQKEIALSFFNILKMFFSEPDNRFGFVLGYVREYFERCRAVSEVFYGFLKRMFLSGARYSESLKMTVFEEIERYFVIHSTYVSDPRLVVFLLNLAGRDDEAFCCRILYILKDFFMARMLQPSVREGIMGKLRALFHRTGNRDLQHLLMDLMRHETPAKDQYRIVCVLDGRGVLDDSLVVEMCQGRYSGVRDLLSRLFEGREVDVYCVEEDEKMYERCVGNLRSGAGRRCGEVERSRRRSRIALVDYE